MQIINEIDNYIQKLHKEFGLNIALLPFNNERLITNGTLMKYNFHSSGFCTYLKNNRDFHKKCIAKQFNVCEKLKTEKVFAGVCHAGVKERVYGIFVKEQFLGFVSVCGYKADKQVYLPRVKRACNEFNFNEQTVLKLYDKLEDDIPSEEHLDSLIFPLIRMIEYGNLLLQKGAESNTLYTEVIRYLTDNFNQKISVSEIAKRFYVSVSHISHSFKRMNGNSISDYVNSLRIEYAKNLLTYTQNSIAEISCECGFFDSSYFCNVFNKKVGVTPKKYRQTTQKTMEN